MCVCGVRNKTLRSEQQYEPHQYDVSATAESSGRPHTMNSLTDTLPPLASDDEDASLVVYTDQIDFGKFREDGSFIGQYNTRRWTET